MKSIITIILAAMLLTFSLTSAEAWYRGGYGYRGGYYGRGWGGYGVAAGIGLGLGVLGGAIASQNYYYGYPAYDYPAYGYYYPGPVYTYQPYGYYYYGW